MAVSRLAVLLVVAALLIPATFLATRQGGDSGSDAPAQPAAPAAKSSTPADEPASAAGTQRAKAAEARASRAEAARRRQALAAASKPLRAIAALERGRTVVLSFTDGRSADDAATAAAVRSLRGKAPGTSVFSERLSNLGDYQKVVGGLGVSQSPSVVIVGADRAAQVVEGYVDPETLLQQVLDARR